MNRDAKKKYLGLRAEPEIIIPFQNKTLPILRDFSFFLKDKIFFKPWLLSP